MVSIGNIRTLWLYLRLANKYDDLPIKSAKQSIVISGIIDKGDLLAETSFALCSSFGFLELNSGKMYLSTYSRAHLLPICDDDEPNIIVLRAIIKQIINRQHFDWLIYFNDDSEIFKLSIPEQNWVDILECASLFDLDDEEVLSWWQDILKKYQNYSDLKKKEIGDVGEKLSYEYELDRLLNDAVEKSYLYVKWASRFSDAYGYDVLSIRGRKLKGKFEYTDKIQIEVKSSVLSSVENFRFRVTRNEWNNAIRNIESYFFHCWTGISLEKGSAERGPFIVPASVLASHIPNDASSICEWTECRFIVDLKKLALP